MDGDIGALVGKLMENPEAMDSIRRIAGGMKSGSNNEGTNSLSAIGTVGRTEISSVKNLKALLSALCPYLQDGKREGVEKMIKIMKLIELSGSAGWLKELL